MLNLKIFFLHILQQKVMYCLVYYLILGLVLQKIFGIQNYFDESFFWHDWWQSCKGTYFFPCFFPLPIYHLRTAERADSELADSRIDHNYAYIWPIAHLLWSSNRNGPEFCRIGQSSILWSENCYNKQNSHFQPSKRCFLVCFIWYYDWIAKSRFRDPCIFNKLCTIIWVWLERY